jgi:hypothetical protein
MAFWLDRTHPVFSVSNQDKPACSARFETSYLPCIKETSRTVPEASIGVFAGGTSFLLRCFNAYCTEGTRRYDA